MVCLICSTLLVILVFLYMEVTVSYRTTNQVGYNQGLKHKRLKMWSFKVHLVISGANAVRCHI